MKRLWGNASVLSHLATHFVHPQNGFIWLYLPNPGIEPRSPVAQMVKNLPAMQETWVWCLGWKDPLGKGMATHSSSLAWRIPWTEEPIGLQSMGSQRVRHDWATPGLCLPLASCLVLTPLYLLLSTLQSVCLRTLPWVCLHPSVKMDFIAEA